MTRLDKDAKDFMAHVGPEQDPADNPAAAAKTLGQAVKAVRSLTDVHRAPTYIAKKVVGEALRGMFDGPEKAAGFSVLVLFAELNKSYGHDWWDWEPETVWQTLERDQKVDVSLPLKDMIGALQVIVKTNFPFEEWHVFEKVAHALNGRAVDFASLQPHELTDLAGAVKILKALRPKQEFSEEVCAYIAACAAEAGMVYLPGDLFPPGADKILETKLNGPDVASLAAHTEDAWKLGPERAGAPTDAAVAIQLGRLSEIKEHAAHA